MWKEYKVTLKFTGWLLGGIPKHPDLIKSWLEARAPTNPPVGYTPLKELAEEVAIAVGAESIEENKVWVGFKSNDNGLYVDGYHLKSHLKDVANIVKDNLKVKNLKAKVADRLFVVEEKLYLGKGAPDGYWEHPVHIMTMQGPRSALKRNDYVEHATISGTLKVLDDKLITASLLESLLEFGSTKGFGAERGLGHGRYEWTLKEIS